MSARKPDSTTPTSTTYVELCPAKRARHRTLRDECKCSCRLCLVTWSIVVCSKHSCGGCLRLSPICLVFTTKLACDLSNSCEPGSVWHQLLTRLLKVVLPKALMPIPMFCSSEIISVRSSRIQPSVPLLHRPGIRRSVPTDPPTHPRRQQW